MNIVYSGPTFEATAAIVGPRGFSFLSGTGAPDNSLGLNGDVYIDTASGSIYNKSSGVWSLSASQVFADAVTAAQTAETNAGTSATAAATSASSAATSATASASSASAADAAKTTALAAQSAAETAQAAAEASETASATSEANASSSASAAGISQTAAELAQTNAAASASAASTSATAAAASAAQAEAVSFYYNLPPISQTVASGNVTEGGWYLSYSLPFAVNFTNLEIAVLTGSGEMIVRIKSDDLTTIYGPAVVTSGSPVTGVVDLDFLQGDAVIVEISGVDDVQSYILDITGVAA